MGLSTDEMREIFERTVIVRKPTHGIVTGYHELPYVCMGSSFETGQTSMRVTGTVQVSPRFILRPQHYEASYAEIFGEDNVDTALVGRVFGFMGFHGRPVECTSERLEISHLGGSVDQIVADTMDDLERREDITTGVIITPNTRYYPISIECFISTILEDEFRA